MLFFEKKEFIKLKDKIRSVLPLKIFNFLAEVMHNFYLSKTITFNRELKEKIRFFNILKKIENFSY